jgi:putative phosphoesterase
VLVISDVHGNYHALDRVMKEVKYDAVVCCGDLVVDYPFPQQCIDALKDYCAYICSGNNDYNVAYNQKASDHISRNYVHLAKDLDRNTDLTLELISDSAKNYLRKLPRECRFVIDGVSFYMNHTVPHLPLHHYLDKNTPRSKLAEYYQDVRADLIVTGHTHVPYVKNFRDKILLNPGSVGEPRDGDPRASFATFDTTTGRIELGRLEYRIELGRLEYDITETSQYLKKLNFPDYSLFCLKNGFLPEDPNQR